MLNAVEVTEGRWQVLDERGRFVAGFNAGDNPAEAFVQGTSSDARTARWSRATPSTGSTPGSRGRDDGHQGPRARVVDVYDEPTWVRSYDPDGHDGLGDVVLTRDRALAHRYVDVAEAMTAWRATSSTHPERTDGKPNRPLTAFTVESSPTSSRGRHERGRGSAARPARRPAGRPRGPHRRADDPRERPRPRDADARRGEGRGPLRPRRIRRRVGPLSVRPRPSGRVGPRARLGLRLRGGRERALLHVEAVLRVVVLPDEDSPPPPSRADWGERVSP